MIKIPCETIVRLCHVRARPDQDVDPIFQAIRLDRGCAIATDRSLLAIEKIGENVGVHHIMISDELLEQCQTEAKFSSQLEIIPNEVLKLTVGKTTFGYNTSRNIIGSRALMCAGNAI